ncbi:hypothetical protein J6590_077176 [Homalodisca vitripennis]|nr:hypothetical protein J6590_077176 [Homalodisca vitripennis]
MGKSAYHSLFEFHLRYGLIVWGSTTAKHLQRVLVIQKRTIRVLTGLRPQDSCREAFRELRILTVVALYIIDTILHSVTTGQTRTGDHHCYNTRNRHHLALETHHTIYERKSSYKGAIYFNILPDSLKKTPVKHVKNSLKTGSAARHFQTCQIDKATQDGHGRRKRLAGHVIATSVLELFDSLTGSKLLSHPGGFIPVESSNLLGIDSCSPEIEKETLSNMPNHLSHLVIGVISSPLPSTHHRPRIGWLQMAYKRTTLRTSTEPLYNLCPILNDEELECSEEVKNLRLIIDKHLR